ncbi:MAG: cellobiose phosphorylase [Candidatus Omnitrophica bacterium]|nr:cellobiose phosphorylase [Candidatus Omnitrophota bacterium]
MKRLWSFTGNNATFIYNSAAKIKSLYFPLCNERIMSSVSPDLHGDIKTGNDAFLMAPVSRIDLVNLKSFRNFWIYINEKNIWSCCSEGSFQLEAGMLWHKVSRQNKKIGISADVLSFIPSSGEPVEIMRVTLKNISRMSLTFVPIVAIPMYCRGANNLRDHRHVTSLLQRITLDKYGVIAHPTLAFDEAGHNPNKYFYFVLGWSDKGNPPQHIYPTQDSFCGDSGDLEHPEAVFANKLPAGEQIQGREPMAALRFARVNLKPQAIRTYTIIMGITENRKEISACLNKFKKKGAVRNSFLIMQDFWEKKANTFALNTQEKDFDNWFRWVSIQPILRRIFGCSFLPDFDYGKGGRGWRDLWQDALGLILQEPKAVRPLLLNNFSGVRIDGSNATIIGKKTGEFISDRNNIPRTWMDHGIWPLLTLDLYLNETGDYDILFEEAPYFRDHLLCRARQCDREWNPAYGYRLTTAAGNIYRGTILEHLLVQNLIQFFNVGRHNHIRLEGADWNDGLDMAKENGESVAFTSMYAQNLNNLAQLLGKLNQPQLTVFAEFLLLLRKIDYNSALQKQRLLEEYFRRTKFCLSGKKRYVKTQTLIRDLQGKASWIIQHIREKEWLREGFFNGYYDNKGRRVEGRQNGVMRICLASQVFPVMSGTATDAQVKRIIESVAKYLWDKNLKGYHLNSDFRQEQHNLGRAFSFVYGDKENGAFFNHMTVMFAYALYKRGFVKEAWQALSSIYNMAMAQDKSKIYPCIPEYFNAEGRGMYSYLTGSASWFVLTLLTQVFGVRGKDGALLIEPKLTREQFNYSRDIGITKIFCNRRIRINFSNPHLLDYGKYKIIKATLDSEQLTVNNPSFILISRRLIQRFPPAKEILLDVVLG